MNESAFSAPIDPSLGGLGLVPTRDGLRRWLLDAGVGEPDLGEVLVAAGEACTNVVEHSSAFSDGAVPAGSIEATYRDGRIRVLVKDRGRWKEPLPTEELGRRGRGRLMMAALMDHLDICTGPQGTTVELIRTQTPGRPSSGP